MERLFRTPGFRKFHLAFWLIAGSFLFISGYSQSNAAVSATRNIYLGVLGLTLSYFLVRGWAKIGIDKIRTSWTLFLAACYLLGTIIIVPINPVTYGQLGVPFDQMTWRHLFAGSMNFSMVLVFWGVCLIFLFKTGFHLPGGKQSPLIGPRTSSSPGALEVDTPGGPAKIGLTAIGYLKGAADYVEVHCLDNKTYLKRATIKSLVDVLEPEGFIRVHRSLVINSRALEGLEGHSKGSFTLVMRNGERLQTSRRYKPAVEAALKR